MESSLWIVDNRGRVKYGNYQSQQSSSSSPGTRLEYACVRHPLPHDVRSASPLVTGHYHRDLIRNDSWLVVAHSAKLGLTNKQSPLEVLLNNLEDSTQVAGPGYSDTLIMFSAVSGHFRLLTGRRPIPRDDPPYQDQ